VILLSDGSWSMICMYCVLSLCPDHRRLSSNAADSSPRCQARLHCVPPATRHPALTPGRYSIHLSRMDGQAELSGAMTLQTDGQKLDAARGRSTPHDSRRHSRYLLSTNSEYNSEAFEQKRDTFTEVAEKVKPFQADDVDTYSK